MDPDRPFDHLVYLKVVEACDLACLHCFIPPRPRHMAPVAELSGALERAGVGAGARILAQLHGGEPTLAGAAALGAIADALDSDPRYHFTLGIQTHGLLLARHWPVWRVFLARIDPDHLGLSWDHAIRVRRREAPAPSAVARYEADFDAVLRLLVADGFSPHLTVTVTRPLIDHVRAFVPFVDRWRRRGVRALHLERLTPDARAIAHWDRIGVDHRLWSDTLSAWLAEYVAYRARVPGALGVSPFDDRLASAAAVASHAPSPVGAGCWSGVCDTRFWTWDAQGLRAGCTALTASAPSVLPPLVVRRVQRRRSCVGCRYRAVCSSGCMRLDVHDGSGECAGGYALFRAAEAHAHVQV